MVWAASSPRPIISDCCAPAVPPTSGLCTLTPGINRAYDHFGFMTPVQMYRDRWECGHIVTAIFAVQATLLIPYIVIAVMGGGTTLNAVSGGVVPYWFGGLIVAAVVMSYVAGASARINSARPGQSTVVS